MEVLLEFLSKVLEYFLNPEFTTKDRKSGKGATNAAKI